MDMAMLDAAARDDRAVIDKAVSLLKAFRGEARAGVGVSELARRSDLSKSTAYRLLGMLQRNGIVERVGSDYRIGQTLQDLGGQRYSPTQDRIRDALTPYVVDLYELTHETVHLAVLDGTDIVYLSKLHGHRTPRSPSRVGGRVPAYCTAVGKALLAYDEEAFEETIRMGLPARTSKTITGASALRDELDRIRSEGVAFDDEELAPGLNCVAVPVMPRRGLPIAALSASGSTCSMDSRKLAPSVRRIGFEASQALSRRLPPAIVR